MSGQGPEHRSEERARSGGPRGSEPGTMSGSTWGDGTRSVRGGEPEPVPGAPLRPSPVFAAPFHLGDLPPRAGGIDAYARTEHPTLRDFESAVGALDGGRCLSFATGMAAISAAVFACVDARDRVVLPSDGYYTTRLLARDELERFVACQRAGSCSSRPRAARPGRGRPRRRTLQR